MNAIDQAKRAVEVDRLAREIRCQAIDAARRVCKVHLAKNRSPEDAQAARQVLGLLRAIDPRT